MEIDVIIPLYKPGKELFTLLDKLGSQSVPVHQVILLNTEEKYFEQLIYGTRFFRAVSEYKSISCIQTGIRPWRNQTDGREKVFCRCLCHDDAGCHAGR